MDSGESALSGPMKVPWTSRLSTITKTS
jgi:hypothetical protein